MNDDVCIDRGSTSHSLSFVIGDDDTIHLSAHEESSALNRRKSLIVNCCLWNLIKNKPE